LLTFVVWSSLLPSTAARIGLGSKPASWASTILPYVRATSSHDLPVEISTSGYTAMSGSLGAGASLNGKRSRITNEVSVRSPALATAGLSAF